MIGSLREKVTSVEIKRSGYQLKENPNEFKDKYMFVNDVNKIKSLSLMEYNMWYEGESMILQNFYRVNNMIDYNYEPVFLENKRSYFWSVSSTEDDFKRTHSGMPREIVDVLTNIIGNSKISLTSGEVSKETLDKENPIESIKEANDWENMEKQTILPMTLVEGWGCIKIDWDTSISDEPIFQYYRANDVDFVYKYKNKLVSIIFKDYYLKEGRKFVLIEERSIEGDDVVFKKNMYEIDINDNLTDLSTEDVRRVFPELNLDTITIENFKDLLAQPFVFFKDTSGLGHGRSIFTGKIDLFDDLDQALSLASIAVRRSTPKVFIDSQYLERDENGFPIAPKEFDTKYVTFKGSKSADGTNSGTKPAEVIQPNIDFEQYQTQASDIVLHILQGIMSPATLGIDVAKKDNADAQREKEKVTVFTREAITNNYGKQVTNLFRQALMVRQYIKDGLANEENPGINVIKYDVHCDFETFADASFENKLTVLGNALTTNCISPELYIEKLWGDKLTEFGKKHELEYIKKSKEQESGGAVGGFNQAGTEAFGDPDEPDYSDSKANSEADMTNESYNRNNEAGK